MSFLFIYLTKDLYVGKPLVAFALFFPIAVVYLGKRQRKQWKKIFLASLVFGGLFGFFFEFFQEYNRSYSILPSIFPFKILGVIPPDNLFAHIMMTAFTMIFYEHFVGFKKNSIIPRKFFFLALIALLVDIGVIILFLNNPASLKIKYSYAILGGIAVIAPIYLSFKNTEFIKKAAPVSYYFFFIYFIIELFAVKYNWWVYQSESYIGWVNVFGLRFPFEELFFWMIFYAPVLIAFREMFLEKGEYA